MIRIYSSIEEIPRGFQETIMLSNIDMSKIQYVVYPDDEDSIPDELRQKAIAIPTITENWIYVVMKGE